MDSAAVTAAVKSSGEVRHPGITKYGATKESELAMSRRTVEQLLNTSCEFFERTLGCSVEFSERLLNALI